MNIVFIGGGNMATAMLGGLIQQGYAAAKLYVVEPDADKRAALTAEYGVQTLAQESALPPSEVVVLAVKPQQLAQVARARATELAGRLIVCIAAGIRMVDLDRWLAGQARLVRVMPNTPALVRAGISGAWQGPQATAADRDTADQILRSIGQVVWVQDEAQIDAVTAVSGSGPAYVFFFIESLTRAAEAQGFDAATARQLAYATFDGAIKLALQSDEDAAVLRERVTSKGGTTAAALNKMADLDVQAAIVTAVQAARDRAASLAEELGRDS